MSDETIRFLTQLAIIATTYTIFAVITRRDKRKYEREMYEFRKGFEEDRRQREEYMKNMGLDIQKRK